MSKLQYDCPECENMMATWPSKEGQRAKCYSCKGETYHTKNLEPRLRDPNYVQKRSLKQLDSVAAALTREQLMNILGTVYEPRTRALISTIYLTAGRVSEVCTYKNRYDKEKPKLYGLKKFQFQDELFEGKKALWIKGVRILKTGRIEHSIKNIPISYKHDTEFICHVKNYLNTLDREAILFKFSASYSRQLLNDYGLYPHLLRDLRVMDLFKVYKWTESKIVKYVGWQDFNTIKHYLKLNPYDLVDENF